MEKSWELMSNREKDLFIAKEVLGFNCFNNNEESDWYEEQYSFGHWRYSTKYEDALDMFKRVMGDNRQAHVILSNDCYECHVIREGHKSYMVNISSNSLPELFCLIAIQLKGKTMQQR